MKIFAVPPGEDSLSEAFAAQAQKVEQLVQVGLTHQTHWNVAFFVDFAYGEQLLCQEQEQDHLMQRHWICFELLGRHLPPS